MARGVKVSETLRNKGSTVEDVETSNVANLLQGEPEADSAPPTLSREERIREAAYAAAERRGFAPGQEDDDWLEAERQIDAQGDSTTGSS